MIRQLFLIIAVFMFAVLLCFGSIQAQTQPVPQPVSDSLKTELMRQNLEAGLPFTEAEITAFHRFMTEAAAQDRQIPSIDAGFYDSPGMATDRMIPLGNRIPLILVHGSGSDLISDGNLHRPLNDLERWVNYLAAFNADPGFYNEYKVYRFVYDSRLSIIENGFNMVNVIDQIDSYPGWEGESLDGLEYVVLAHSMGGLVMRTAMNIPFSAGVDAGIRMGERVISPVTLGTPNHGSPLAVPAWAYDSVLRGSGITELEFNFSYVLHWAFDPFEGQFDLAWDNYDNGIPLGDIVTYSDLFIPKMEEVGGGLGQHIETLISPFTILLNSADHYSDKLLLFSGKNPPHGNLNELLDLVFYYTLGLLNEHHMLGFSSNKLAQVIAGDIGGGDTKPYTDNDGLVPAVSALFEGATVSYRQTFDQCDHLTLLDSSAVINAVRAKLIDIAAGAGLDGSRGYAHRYRIRE
ncbi:MAG: hypothetical protein ABIK28_02675 [Planctomycetota bacterium]